MQDCSNSIANAMELLQSFTELSIFLRKIKALSMENGSTKYLFQFENYLRCENEINWKKIGSYLFYRNVPIRSALPNRSAPQVSLYIVTD